MYHLLLVIHGILCIVLIVLVLLQQGKGADMGATLGGSSNTVFGAGGATDFITKLTTSIAIAFMVTSILLVRMYTLSATSSGTIANPLEGSVMQGEAQPAPVVQVPPAGENKPAENKADNVVSNDSTTVKVDGKDVTVQVDNQDSKKK